MAIEVRTAALTSCGIATQTTRNELSEPPAANASALSTLHAYSSAYTPINTLGTLDPYGF
jgi:hypothetical protein